MTKRNQLTKRQLAVLEDLFTDFSLVDEQAVLDKHKVSRKLYNKWLADASFIEQFNQRIAAAHRQSAALIARYAPLAATKLVQLTDSEKEETARKACLDIISLLGTHSTTEDVRAAKDGRQMRMNEQQDGLSAEAASRLLAALAGED